MILFLLLGVVLFLILLDQLLNHNARARTLGKVPGPPKKFLFANTLDAMRSPDQLFAWGRELAAKYNGIYQLWCWPMAIVNIYNPEDIEKVIATTKFNDKSLIYKFLKPWLQEGLLVSKGQKWHERRKVLTPAFHFNILKEFCGIMERNSYRLVERLKETRGKSIDITPIISEYALDSICETAMGTKLKDNKNAGNSYKESIYALGKLITTRFAHLYLLSDFIFNRTHFGEEQEKHLKIMHNFTNNLIEERKEYTNKSGFSCLESNNVEDETFMTSRKKNIAMLDLLLLAERDGGIDRRGIQEEVDTFMFEGHDTTASGLTFLLMSLANNAQIQNKLSAELSEVLGDSDQPASVEQLNRLRYMECVIKEGLRLYPPVHFISREIGEEVELSNYKIPAGSMCHIHIFDLHRRADLFMDPMKFDPERFLPEKSIERHPYSYIPFSAGPRNCIGQKFAILEMKSCLASILRSFVLEPVTKEEDVVFMSDLVLRSVSPVCVKFVSRCKVKAL